MCEANDDDLCIPRSAMYKLVKELGRFIEGMGRFLNEFFF